MIGGPSGRSGQTFDRLLGLRFFRKEVPWPILDTLPSGKLT